TWFATFFKFPVLVFRIEPTIVILGAAVMFGSATLGTLVTLSTVIKMRPVVAMTPAAPTYRPTFFDRSRAITRLSTPVVRMILRSLTRRPSRALLTTAGMSMAIAIVAFGGFTADALDRVVDVRYYTEERQDMSVSLTHARSLERSAEFNRLPGVRI